MSYALPPDRLELDFPDDKPPLSAGEARAEASRCIYCHDAPCIRACPTGIDIPEFIRRIATGNLAGSAQTILDANVLGLTCSRACPVEVLCEGSCVYHGMQAPPIKIGRLQRHAMDDFFARGGRPFAPGRESGQRVGLLGGGPASLACAAELRRLGHAATIYERSSRPGGLNLTGVAPYKHKAQDVLREVELVRSLGVEIKTGVAVGRDLSFEEFRSAHDAVFIGAGLGPDSRLGIGGEDLRGVRGAVAFIEELKTAPRAELDRAARAVVIGGGNTALDAARELARLGLAEVSLVYRRTEEEMPGYVHEYKKARQEGVRFVFLAAPLSFEGQRGELRRLRLQRMALGAAGPDGRRKPIPVQGQEFTIECDLALLAAGQETFERPYAAWGLKVVGGKLAPVNGSGRLADGIWAGGDCVNGGKEVVNAAQEGKLAARDIDLWLRKGRPKG